MKTKLVIFTDLDGTLLNHDDYSYTAAEPALNFIRKYNIPLIFTTSKTAIEIEDLCRQTNFYHPFIAENGGLLATPEGYFSDHQTTKVYRKHIIGKTRSEINAILQNFVDSYIFKSFKSMSTQELIDHTGLDNQQAIYANQRDTTEPLLWLDDTPKLNNISAELDNFDLRLVSGGRFHHVMGKHDKATTMSTMIRNFEKHWKTKITTIALGDSPNDIEMLQTANYGIVIPNPSAPKMCVDNHANLRHAEHPGAQGWNDSLLALFKELI